MKLKLPPEHDQESTGPAKVLLVTVLFLAAVLIAAALSSCTCTMNGEELARAIIIYQTSK